jgi:2-dehydropantoate 2-reductase
MTRRYVIIGAGAIGALLAAQLQSSGARVVLVARGSNLEVIRERGLRVRRPAGDDVVRLDVVGDIHRVHLTGDDVLVLATKAQDAEAALVDWAWQPVAGGGVAADLPILTFQNGLASDDLALRRFSRVYAVSIVVAASHLAPGEIVSPSFPTVGLVWIGRFPGGEDDLQAGFASDLERAGFATRSVADIGSWKARKLLGNVGNAIDVFSGTDEERVNVRSALTAETRAVFAAAGVRVADDEPHAALDIQPVAGHTPGLLSTWQSFARGVPNEVDYLNGEVVLIARRAGVGAPLNEAIQRILGAQTVAGDPPGTHALASLRVGVVL